MNKKTSKKKTGKKRAYTKRQNISVIDKKGNPVKAKSHIEELVNCLIKKERAYKLFLRRTEIELDAIWDNYQGTDRDSFRRMIYPFFKIMRDNLLDLRRRYI